MESNRDRDGCPQRQGLHRLGLTSEPAWEPDEALLNLSSGRPAVSHRRDPERLNTLKLANKRTDKYMEVVQEKERSNYKSTPPHLLTLNTYCCS